MVITGTLPAVRGALLFFPQILGGIVAAALVRCMFPGPLLVQTTLQNGTSIAQGLFIEMFLTIELEITVLFMAAEKHKATYMAPVAIGLALFTAELAGTLFFRRVSFYSNCFHTHSYNNRRLLHRRFPQSSTILRAGCCKCQFPRLSLDLLARSNTRGCHCRRLLQVGQVQ